MLPPLDSEAIFTAILGTPDDGRWQLAMWLRDAAFTIEAMISHDYLDGDTLWRDWLLRAIAGEPEDLRIMYGVGGEKHLPEVELEHLAGYAESRPVRIGNGAAGQYQADVTAR